MLTAGVIADSTLVPSKLDLTLSRVQEIFKCLQDTLGTDVFIPYEKRQFLWQYWVSVHHVALI